jgi:hypothetical protein
MVAWNQPGVDVRLNAFCLGSNFHLIEYWYDGTNWNTTDHGQPGGASPSSSPAVAVWYQYDVPVRLNAFCGT